MKHKILFIQGVLVSIILLGSQARADFLGLAPGDYNVTLLSSTALCSGVDCVGQIHIPTGTVTTGNFHWNFQIGSNLFDWTHNLTTSTSPNGLNTCAVETAGGARAWRPTDPPR